MNKIPIEPVTYYPIGHVRSPYKNASGAPIQPHMAPQVEATVEILPEYAEGLKDLEEFSHIYLICHLDRSRPWKPLVIPYLDTEYHGVFACRAPSRPNSIGLSLVRLVERRDNILRIAGVDILDGTPVLDIKPYVPDFDERKEVRLGWYENVRETRKKYHEADSRFEEKPDKPRTD
jgi:tRNA-Thr(GGU) m(6)t(6)A37 methyltransferase TsaA